MFPHAGSKEILLWLLRRRRRFRIEGHSMEPVLREGDEVLVKSLPPHPLLTSPIQGEEIPKNSPPLVGGARGGVLDRVRVGDVVVAEHPKRRGFMVVKQWDGKTLQSLCHRECAVRAGRVLAVVTSVITTP